MDRLQMQVFMQLYNCFMGQFRKPLDRQFFSLSLLKEGPELLRQSYRHRGMRQKLRLSTSCNHGNHLKLLDSRNPTAFTCRKYGNINGKLKIKFHRLCMHLGRPCSFESQILNTSTNMHLGFLQDLR